MVASVLFPSIEISREAARRTQSKNNLKQIGLALHNDIDVHQGLPPGGVFNHEGRGYHGWMTSILPFLDASPFYNFVNFNEPWDSPENAGLFLNANQYFENPSEPAVRRNWEFPVAHYSANAHLMAVSSFEKFSHIARPEKLFVVGELDGDFVPWGCPYNWRELKSINSEPPTYGRSTRNGCQFLFVDGHVDFVSNVVSKDVLKNMSGEDLVGFHDHKLNIHRPAAFPCPEDALIVSWSVEGGNLIVVRSDKEGNVKGRENRGGK